MPYKIEYENDSTGAYITFTGEATGSEIVAVNKEIYSEDKIFKLKYQLWDFTAASYFNIDKWDVHQTIEQDKWAFERNPDQVIAIVGSDNFFYHADTMYEMQAEDLGIKVKRFETVDEAFTWIDSHGTASE